MSDTFKKELQELRLKVNQSSDEQLEAAMHDEWMHGSFADVPANDDTVQVIHQRVMSRIKKRKSTMRMLLRYTQIAASIILPVCLIAMYLMYRENQHYASIPMTEIITHQDEQVNVTLPDGTVVGMNSMSKLKYALQNFSNGKREIYFDGEGLYQVTKDRKHPFTINSLGMKITVIGTEFNLVNRVKDNKAEIALIDGCVQLVSLVSGKSYTMSPKEVVVIDKKTGKMGVRRDENIADFKAWQQKQMIFRNVPLAEVITSIEKNYRVAIVLDVKDTARFTGTLPTNNLNEALKIIKLTYGVDIASKDKSSFRITK